MALFILLLSYLTLSVSAYSEESPVVGAPLVRSIELNKGEQVTGNLTIYNLPPKGTSYELGVWIEDPDGNIIQAVLMSFKSPTRCSGTFNFTASYSGMYRIKIVYADWSGSGIIPTAHLYYQVKGQSPFGINLKPETIYLIIGLIAVPIASYIIFKAMKH